MEWDESDVSDPVQSNHKQSQYSLKILSRVYWQDTEILLTNFFDSTKNWFWYSQQEVVEPEWKKVWKNMVFFYKWTKAIFLQQEKENHF